MVRKSGDWIESCPFAKGRTSKIKFDISSVTLVPRKSSSDLIDELEVLKANPEKKIDTTLLIHPMSLQDFDFNDFLEVADATLEDRDLDGILQVASFHPAYQFEDTDMDDIEILPIAPRIRPCIC